MAEFALRLSVRHGRGDWIVLVVPTDKLRDAADGVLLELIALGEPRAVRVSGADGAIDFVRHLKTIHGELAICTDLQGFGAKDWEVVDARRSELQDLPLVTLLLSQEQLKTLSDSAPHFASWLTSSVSYLDPTFEGLTDEERESRLAQFRQVTGLSDDEALQKAAIGTLGRDPMFAEWLVLLKRGDLLVN